jgi:hypothetical protein
MRRHLLLSTLAGVLGLLLCAGDASACCHKRRCPTPVACCTTPVVACAPAPCPPPPPPCPPPACGCGHRFRLFGHKWCHRRAACAAPVACATTVVAPAPVFVAPSGQGY